MKVLKIRVAFAIVLILVVSAGCTAGVDSGERSSQRATTDSGGNGVSSTAQGGANVNWPMLHNTVAVNSSQAVDVEAAIKQADRINSYTALTFDLSMLPAAYVDDSNVPTTAEQAQFIHDVIAAQGPAVASQLNGSGWLT